MNLLRYIFLSAILIAGFFLSYMIYREEVKVPFGATLAPAFQLLGRPIKNVDRALTQVLPIDSLDEARYGDVIYRRYKPYNGGTQEDQAYVQRLVETISLSGKKGFTYHGLILDSAEMNAFALPGGVVFVTSGLLHNMHSEAELAAVLAHEVGHVELSHCLDSVRFEIAARKIGTAPLGELADLAMNLMLRHSYSKTQEEEADEYAWSFLKQSSYSPEGEGLAFARLLKRYGTSGTASNVVSEYFKSHPYLELREARYRTRFQEWIADHPNEERKYGYKNLQERTTLADDPSLDP